MFRSKRKAELSSLSDKVTKRVRVSKATKRAYRACAVRRGFALQCFLVKVVVQLEYIYILPKRFIVSLHIATYSIQLVYLPPPLLPVTLHCSDGVVRSGTFLVIHSQLERLKTEGVVDVFQAVKSARIQRPGVIPNIVCFNIISLLVRGVPSFHCK